MRRNSMFLSLAGIALTIAAIAVAHRQAGLPDAGAAAAVPKTKINVVVDG